MFMFFNHSSLMFSMLIYSRLEIKHQSAPIHSNSQYAKNRHIDQKAKSSLDECLNDFDDEEPN
jgi:hypothetical protein